MLRKNYSYFYTPPAYPIMYYDVFSAFGIGKKAYEALQVVSILMNIGIVFLIYRIGRLFRYKIGCLAALLVVLDTNGGETEIRFKQWRRGIQMMNNSNLFVI